MFASRCNAFGVCLLKAEKETGTCEQSVNKLVFKTCQLKLTSFRESNCDKVSEKKLYGIKDGEQKSDFKENPTWSSVG